MSDSVGIGLFRECVSSEPLVVIQITLVDQVDEGETPLETPRTGVIMMEYDLKAS
ncbi:MAG: hypothetical protein LDL31_07485 [Prosthecobacter sp.]|jgi:hypothetical protein|nr:hypothetical protein [Prosthecobacter sp.]